MRVESAGIVTSVRRGQLKSDRDHVNPTNGEDAQAQTGQRQSEDNLETVIEFIKGKIRRAKKKKSKKFQVYVDAQERFMDVDPRGIRLDVRI